MKSKPTNKKIQSRLKRLSKEALARIEQWQAAKHAACTSWQYAEFEVQRHRHQLLSHQELYHVYAAKAVDVSEEILRHPKVTGFTLEHKGFSVTTKNLYVKCGDIKYDIGRFKIQFTFGNFMPRWSNLTRQVEGVYGSLTNHPHIWRDGSACLGNAQAMFQSLTEQWEFASLVGLAIRFVESVDVNDQAGRYIRQWPIVESKPTKSKTRRS